MVTSQLFKLRAVKTPIEFGTEGAVVKKFFFLKLDNLKKKNTHQEIKGKAFLIELVKLYIMYNRSSSQY